MWQATRRFDPATTVLHVDLAPWSSALLVWALSHRFVVFQTLHTAPPVLPFARRWVWRTKIELLRAAPDYHLTLGNRDAGLGFDRLLGHALGATLTPTRSTSTSSTRPGRRSTATAASGSASRFLPMPT